MTSNNADIPHMMVFICHLRMPKALPTQNKWNFIAKCIFYKLQIPVKKVALDETELIVFENKVNILLFV